MNKEELVKAWKAYTENTDFMLNPDDSFVDNLAKGVLKNEEKHGLKLCPCRLSDGSREKNLEILCPCNFKTHNTWESKGMCWCGLFVKRK